MPWTKSGYPVTTVGRLAMPKATRAAAAATGPNALDGLHNWKLADDDIAVQPVPGAAAVEAEGPRTYLLGYGARNPIFRLGLPADFVVRRGAAAADFHFSGTYRVNDRTIGYLRIPSFSPSSVLNAVRELETEILYFQDNTDGLVVDVMRNPGGGCYMLDVAAHLIPHPFFFFGEQIRPTQDRLLSFYSQLLFARATGAPQWVINTYERAVWAMEDARAEGRTLTDPIPACVQTGSNGAPQIEGNVPTPIVYTKPMIVLIDEFSTSAADIFPAMIQDNERALLVGRRTNGGGGSSSSWPTGFYSESISSNTNSLVVRKRPIVSGDLPTAPYIENIGALPDIPLEYMTLDNLLNNGKTFVEQFSSIIVDQIDKARSN
jgi:hypothetical protein